VGCDGVGGDVESEVQASPLLCVLSSVPHPSTLLTLFHSLFVFGAALRVLSRETESSC